MKENITEFEAATSQNTPLPGGGSWHWDDTVPGWVENLPPGTEPAPQQPDPINPINETKE